MADDDDFGLDIDPKLDENVAGLNQVQTAALAFAETIAAQWRDDAPVGDGDTPGAYRDGILAEPTKRGARVISTDFTSAWNEFGAPANNEPARFIGRTAALKVGAHFMKSDGS